jgi:hypothetical protein
MNDLDDKDWSSNNLSIPDVLKNAHSKIKNIFDKQDGEFQDDTRSNRSDDENNNNNNFDDDGDGGFSSKNNNNNNIKKANAYKDNLENDFKKIVRKNNNNNETKLSNMKLNPIKNVKINNNQTTANKITAKDLFDIDDNIDTQNDSEFGEFVANTENFANFDDFNVKA